MTIRYSWLYDQARKRFDSDEALEGYLPQPKTDQELEALTDDRYLSVMTRRVFRAGMTHSVVDARWPAFEALLWGFDPQKMVLLSPEQIEKLARDERLIRHATKMRTIPINAQMVLDVAEKHGSFGRFLTQWPNEDLPGLWQYLVKHGTRLGSTSAPKFLRMVGRDTFIMTNDVAAALASHKVIDTSPTSKAALKAAQATFTRLHEASGRPYCQLSSMLALTINPRF